MYTATQMGKIASTSKYAGGAAAWFLRRGLRAWEGPGGEDAEGVDLSWSISEGPRSEEAKAGS